MDLADRLQTPIIVLSDLELGMNDNLSEPFAWDDDRRKVLSAADLDAIETYGRYVDADGIGQRTLPGTHPDGARSSPAAPPATRTPATPNTRTPTSPTWTGCSASGRRRAIVPRPEIDDRGRRAGFLFYGTTALPIPEALDRLPEDGVELDTLRIRSFPLAEEIRDFVPHHDIVFLAEQNRDAQMKTLLVNDLGIDPAQIESVLCHGGFSISADTIHEQVLAYYEARKLPRLREVGT